MELSCPSCSTKHKTEDYAGAFEIQCACGYSILVPDESLAQSNLLPPESDPVPSFDDAPMAMDTLQDATFEVSDELSDDLSIEQNDQAFSSLNLSSPEQLPEEMPYDPFELQTQWSDSHSEASKKQNPPETPLTPTPNPSLQPQKKPISLAQDVVNRIQMSSIGHIHGALFDLEFENLSIDLAKDLTIQIKKFLTQHNYLREKLPLTYEKEENVISSNKLPGIPEVLAVEIYLYCSHNQIKCQFRPSKES